MEPVTPLLVSAKPLLEALVDTFIKPSASNHKELVERHHDLNTAYVAFDLTMDKLFAQMETGNYDMAQTDLMEFESAIEKEFRQVIRLVEDLRTKISLLDINELTERLSIVAEKCTRVIGEWKLLQRAITNSDHDSMKRYCWRSYQVIKAYVEDIQSLADYAEITLKNRQLKLRKPKKPVLKNNTHRK